MGTEWHSYLLAKELSKKHSIYVFSKGRGEAYSEYGEEFDGIPVKRINTPISERKFLETYVDDRVALSFSEFLDDLEPDLIHIQHCIGLGVSIIEVAVQKQIPTVLFLHDFYLMCHTVHLLKPNGKPCPGPRSQRYCAECIQSFDRSLSDMEARNLGIERYHHVQGLLSRIDRIVVPSEFVKKMFQQNFPKIREITISTLGLDLRFTKNYRKKQSRRLRFGYLGVVCWHKGLHVLVEAFKRLNLRDVELRIHGYGDPDYLKTLHDSARNTNIRLFGPYTHSELSKVLSEIDVFVMPSICHESFSFTIRESLAVGIPVVVSDIGAQSDAILERVNGLHFKCGDPNDLKEKLELLVNEPGMMKRLTDNARRSRIRPIGVQVEELQTLYRKSIRTGKKPLARLEQQFPTGRPLINVLSYIRALEKANRNGLIEEKKRLKSELIQQFTEPMGKLLALYANRPDLQSAFPEAENGEYSRLMHWARDVLAAGHDGASGLMADCAKWYMENEWLRLAEELSKVKADLAQRESVVQGVEAEKRMLAEELSKVKADLAQRESVVQGVEAEKRMLAEELSKVRNEFLNISKELGLVKESFGYHFMRSYAKRIDKLLPEGTRRGGFRKIVVASLRVVGREGISSFLSKAWEKLRRQEFRIVEPVKISYPVVVKGQYPTPPEEPLPQSKTHEQMLRVKLNLFLSDHSSNLVFPQFNEPAVSIVIPTFNKVEYLYQCLESILMYADVPFELIIADDCSSDATPNLLRKCKNAEILRNEENLEFIRTCNRGASLAKGRYILFLNNDVTITAQSLSTLVATMERYQKCGAVGVKLVRMDGTLQEAGSIIWKDGSALGYGRGDDPLKPEYCYLREVDYCSAACLIVRTDLFQKLGGFDELYLPAYYEDSDLCFGIWKLGYKVIFQPRVTVFHHEFGSRSFDRAEALCQINRQKFEKKWASNLWGQGIPGDFLRGRDRRQGKRVLVIDDQVPAPHLGIGLPRARRMLAFLSELGYTVTFLPLINPTPWQPATHQLQQTGVEVFYGDSFEPEEFLRGRSGYFDIVIVSRPHNAVKVLGLARQCFPDASIIYDAEALFSLREISKAEVEGRTLTEMEKRRMLREELDLMKEADTVVTVSETEGEIIRKEGAHGDVVAWGHTHDLYTSVTPFSERRNILFVGAFTYGHPPNTDAVTHFTTRVLPRIIEKLPDCHFIIVGSQPPESVRKLASKHVVVTRFIENLREYYEKCRVCVIPLRFGGGISYKVTEAMSYGTPTVVSTVAGSGLGLRDGEETLIANNDQEFVEKTLRLYTDEDLWHEIQREAQRYIRDNCSPEIMKRKLAEVLKHRLRKG